MKAASNTRMDVMSHSLTVVNDSMHQLDTKLTSHSSEVKHTLDGVEKSLGDIRDRMAAFESHPSTIGEVCYNVDCTDIMVIHVTALVSSTMIFMYNTCLSINIIDTLCSELRINLPV